MKLSTFISTFNSVLLVLCAAILLSSCKKNRELTGPIPGRSTNHIIEKLDEQLLDFEWFGAKISSEVKYKDGKHSFKTNLRVKKDSAIWMSISPALGIEVARMLITPDSIKFIDKWNDQYFLGDYAFMAEKFEVHLDFYTLQDMVVGNPMLYDNSEKFKSTKEDRNYVLTSKNKSKVRRAAGIRYNRRNVEEMNDSLSVEFDEKLHDRAMKRTDEEELVLKRYWVSGDSFKTMRAVVTDLATYRSIEADYAEFEEAAGQELPTSVSYKIIDKGEASTFQMEYSRIKINQEFTFPFTIPEKFVRIN